MKILNIVALTIMIVIFSATYSEAGWLIYHKPEFKGRVVDAETNEPLEGAVVVVSYYKYPLIGGPGGKNISLLNVRETLTAKDGSFRIPSYTTIIPFSVEYKAVFIIFKPGYASVSGLDLAEEYAKDSDRKEVEYPWLYNKDLKFRFAPRVVGLPRVKTKEERKQAWMGADIFGADVKARELPLLYKMINDESKIWF